jgi:hypothetical protein
LAWDSVYAHFSITLPLTKTLLSFCLPRLCDYLTHKSTEQIMAVSPILQVRKLRSLENSSRIDDWSEAWLGFVSPFNCLPQKYKPASPCLHLPISEGQLAPNFSHPST